MGSRIAALRAVKPVGPALFDNVELLSGLLGDGTSLNRPTFNGLA
jgi:hypothetical protein